MFGAMESDTDVWKIVAEPSQVERIKQQSKKRPQLVYKHSHRCGNCMLTKRNLEQSAGELSGVDMHFINVIKSREASDLVASQWDIRHESPQVILIENEEVAWHASHGNIDVDAIVER